MIETYSNYKVLPAFGIVVRPSGAGIAVDLQGYEGVTFVFQSGAMGEVAATYTWKLQESDAAGSGYADVAAADMAQGVATVVFNQEVGADANAAKKLGYIGTKRYLKAYCTESTAGTPNSIIVASAVLNVARHLPTS